MRWPPWGPEIPSNGASRQPLGSSGRRWALPSPMGTPDDTICPGSHLHAPGRPAVSSVCAWRATSGTSLLRDGPQGSLWTPAFSRLRRIRSGDTADMCLDQGRSFDEGAATARPVGPRRGLPGRGPGGRPLPSTRSSSVCFVEPGTHRPPSPRIPGSQGPGFYADK